MSNLISIVSSPSLERWDWRNPEKGIGGSETSHVRMAQILSLRGHQVTSFSPVPEEFKPDPTDLTWLDSSYAIDAIPTSNVLINYRDPKLFDAEKPVGARNF